MTDTKLYTELLSESLDPENFAAATAEAFGAADRNLRKAFSTKNEGLIADALSRLLLVGKAYTMALRQQSLGRDYTSTLLMIILNVDMAGGNPADYAPQLLDFHSQFMMQCGQLLNFYSDDKFALPHIKCIAYMEAAIFLHFVEKYGTLITDSIASLTYAGQAEAARDLLADKAPEGCIPVEPLDMKGLLIDIFSRFNALGYF